MPKRCVKPPYLSTEQMVEVDRAMMEDYRIELIQMMENAGRNLAHLARSRFLSGDPRDREIVALAGSGGNGGGTLVATRRLHNWGARVQVFVSASEDKFPSVPAHQLDIIHRMGIPISTAEDLPDDLEPDLILDDVIGYSLKGAPRGDAAELIRWANASDASILALDVPSGVDATTGTAFEPAVRATTTMTLALPKHGLRATCVDAFVGELYVLYAESALGIEVGPIFAEEEIIRLK
jgi:NAD(P)H-hydrate epimerase